MAPTLRPSRYLLAFRPPAIVGDCVVDQPVAVLVDLRDGSQHDLGPGHASWSPDGSAVHLVVSPARNAPSIRTVDLTGTVLSEIDDGLLLGDFLFSWSPDGTQIAFWRYEKPANPDDCAREDWLTDAEAVRDLVVMDADGGHQRVILARRWNPNVPTWSPDGRSIAATDTKSRAKDGVGVELVDVASGSARSVNPLAARLNWLTWFPAGDRIAVFEESDRGEVHLHTLGIQDGSDAVVRFPDWTSGSAWSHDMTRLVAPVRDAAGNLALAIIRASDGTPDSLGLNDAGAAVWSPDDRRLAFERLASSGPMGDNVGGLDLIDVDGSHRRQLPGTGGLYLLGFQPGSS